MNDGHDRSYGLLALTETEFAQFANLTRRRLLIGAGGLALGALTGCGPGEQAAVPTATVLDEVEPPFADRTIDTSGDFR